MSRDIPPMDDKDEHIRQLGQRVEKLEATINKMLPGRRDAMKLGGAAVIGAAAMSGTASAGSSQVGTIGTSASRVDLNSEDIDNSDTITTQNLVVNGTATGTFGGGGVVFEEGDSLTEHDADRVGIGGSSFLTIFDLGSPVDVYGGSVYGHAQSQLRVTFGTGTTTLIGSNTFTAGDGFTGEEFTVHPVFPMKNVEKLEVFNASGSSRVLGFQVFTT